jgi:hypothetical protein
MPHSIGFATFVAWSTILALSFMLVGGLVLWAYGARPKTAMADGAGPEAEATRLFHTRLSRWFFCYGITVIALGSGLLLWAYSLFN